MIYTATTKKAIKLMYEAHKDQVDKAGMPYVLHPLHVAEEMEDETRTIVALLHDVVEDSDITFEKLSELGFSNTVIESLKLLTHDEDIDYFDYIQNIGTNPISISVKLADLRHNSDLSRLDKITNEDILRVEKYKKCIDYLEKIQSMQKSNTLTDSTQSQESNNIYNQEVKNDYSKHVR